MKLRQSPRLKEFDYTGPFAYHLTFVARGRRPVFEVGNVVQLCVDALKKAAVDHRFEILAYCFMPDHTHVLVAGREGSSLQDFARAFKQLSGYAYKQRSRSSLWQISYYDHVVRRDEDLGQVAAYIWDSPVRAELAEDRFGYGFSGPRELMEQA